MSEAERKAFVDGARYGWDVENRATRTWQVDAEALRRYPDAPPPGDSGLRDAAIETVQTWAHVVVHHDEPGVHAMGKAIVKLDAALGRPAETQGDEDAPTLCTCLPTFDGKYADSPLCRFHHRPRAETLTPSEGGDTTFEGKPPAPKRWRCQGCGWKPTDEQVSLLRTTAGGRHDHFTGKKWCGPVEPVECGS
jgi:hypothetical protein